MERNGLLLGPSQGHSLYRHFLCLRGSRWPWCGPLSHQQTDLLQFPGQLAGRGWPRASSSPPCRAAPPGDRRDQHHLSSETMGTRWFRPRPGLLPPSSLPAGLASHPTHSGRVQTRGPASRLCLPHSQLPLWTEGSSDQMKTQPCCKDEVKTWGMLI